MKKDDCVFCRIVRGEIPADIIYEDKEVIAFLDNFPCVKGQTLVIPKKHVGYFIDLDDNLYKKLMAVAKRVAKAIHKVTNPVKVGVIIEGLEVDHVHIKLYPLSKGGFAEVIRCKPKISKEDMKEIAGKIKEYL
jgi:histidine triad (HIT) family protein